MSNLDGPKIPMTDSTSRRNFLALLAGAAGMATLPPVVAARVREDDFDLADGMTGGYRAYPRFPGDPEPVIVQYGRERLLDYRQPIMGISTTGFQRSPRRRVVFPVKFRDHVKSVQRMRGGYWLAVGV